MAAWLWNTLVNVLCLTAVLHLADAMWEVGWPATWRRSEDSVKKASFIINPSMKNTREGIVTGWHVYTSRGRRSQMINLQVWRPMDHSLKSTRFKLVGQTIFIAQWIGHNYVPLYPEDRIHIMPNDTLGLYFHKFNPVPWNSVACGLNNRHLFKYNPRNMEIGSEVSFDKAKSDWKPCRIYSLNATVMSPKELENYRYEDVTIDNIRGFHGHNLPTRHPLVEYSSGGSQSICPTILISFVIGFCLRIRKHLDVMV